MILMSDTTLACLAILEDEASKLYEVLVTKSEHPEVSLLFDEILQETKTHRELLTHASKILGQPSIPSLVECEKTMGKLFSPSIQLIRHVKDQVLNGLPVVEAASMLMKFEEEAAGEEGTTLTYINPHVAMTTNNVIKRVLAHIAEDEKRHADILKLIVEISGR